MFDNSRALSSTVSPTLRVLQALVAVAISEGEEAISRPGPGCGMQGPDQLAFCLFAMQNIWSSRYHRITAVSRSTVARSGVPDTDIAEFGGSCSANCIQKIEIIPTSEGSLAWDTCCDLTVLTLGKPADPTNRPDLSKQLDQEWVAVGGIIT